MKYIIAYVFLTVHTFAREEDAKKLVCRSDYINLDGMVLKAEYAKVCVFSKFKII